MSRSRSVSQLVDKVDRSGTERATDHLVVEEPLEIRLDGVRVTTTMRTPGHDGELAAGFCFSDGLLGGASVLGVDHGAGNAASVDTGGQAPVPTTRLTATTSSCGWCGTDALDDLASWLEPLGSRWPFDVAVLGAVVERVRQSQDLFELTGGVHAAAAFDRTGRPEVVREDIGRHNAVDKVVGRLLLDGRLPAGEMGLFVSGRTSFEIVQKAWAAGFSAVVSVSAPSSLAVDTARRAGLMLAGFARPGRLNVYVP